MKWVVLAILTLMTAIMAPQVHTAVQRSNQKKTMATMYSLAEAFEKGRAVTGGKDAWGHDLQIVRNGPHYLIRAAASDGRFQPIPPIGTLRPVTTSEFSDDLILRDGFFLQFPEGICYGDVPGKGPLARCASCHPHRIRQR